MTCDHDIAARYDVCQDCTVTALLLGAYEFVPLRLTRPLISAICIASDLCLLSCCRPVQLSE